MKNYLVSLVVVLVSGFLVSTFSARDAMAASTIKIGVPGAHSGDLASYGLPTVKAAELVIKEVNANGGLLGKKVELLVEDDACKPELAANTAAKLVSQEVDAVIGHICSGATKAALGIYKDAHLVTISPSASSSSLERWRLFFLTADRSAAHLLQPGD